MYRNESDKCKNYMSYFIERYCKLLTPNGIENIRLLKLQKKYIDMDITQEDKDKSLSISNYKLIYAGLVQGWIPPKEYYNDDYSFHVYIDDKLFPEVTFENSPQEVELKLV